jgi:hypothetical protein
MMKALFTILALSFVTLARAKDVQVTVYQVEVSHEKMSSLLAEGHSDAELFTKVRGMIAAKSATLRDTSLLRLKAGEKATIESIRTVRYLMEENPDSFDQADNEFQRILKLPPEEQQKFWARALLAHSFFPVLGGWDRISCESRDVGYSLEVEAGEEGAGLIWWLECVSYERDTEIGRTLGLDGKPRIQRMPNFDMMSLRGDSPSTKGITLAGVLTPVAADGGLARDRKIMVFVKADILEEK